MNDIRIESSMKGAEVYQSLYCWYESNEIEFLIKSLRAINLREKKLNMEKSISIQKD